MNNDIKLGLRMEHRLYKILKKLNPNTVWNSKVNPYSTFDYTNGDWVYELKSRRYAKERFDKEGHMCEPEKFKHLKLNPHLKGKIFLMYHNGLWVYDVSKDTELKGIQERVGGRMDRGRDEIKNQSFIHKDYLKLVSRNICVPEEGCLIGD